MDMSIIIPIYNVESYLTECLESVLHEVRDKDAEVLLIDDGSTDGSSQLARAFAEAHDGFDYYRTENHGLSAARNYGVRYAQGDYLWFIDSDDVIVEDCLGPMLQLARQSGAEITICEVARLEGKGKIKPSTLQHLALSAVPHTTTNVYEYPNIVYDCHATDKLIRRDFYLANGTQFPEGYLFEDLPTMTGLFLCAKKVSIMRSVGYLWRQRSKGDLSITQQHSRKNLNNRIAMIHRTFQVIKRYGSPTGVLEVMQTRVLTREFRGYIADLWLLDPTEAQKYVELMAATIESHIPADFFDRVPLKYQQQTRYLLNRDVEGLIRLDNYMRESYDRAEVQRVGDRLRIYPSDAVFSIESRDFTNDALAAIPRSYVDRVRVEGESLVLQGHLYTPRVTIADPAEQSVSAHLVNECSGVEVELSCTSCACPKLTESAGVIVSRDDYLAHRYNYDGTGFEVTISPSQLEGIDGLGGNNAIILSYENYLKKGARVLRGMSASAARAASSYHYAGPYGVRAYQDSRGTFFLHLEDRKNVSR